MGGTLGSRQTCARGFTAVELLVAAAIIGVLVGLTLAAVQKVRAAAARAACASNLRQLALAAHGYAERHGRLPKGCDYPFLTDPSQYRQHTGLSWHTSLLPDVEQGDLWASAWEAHRQNPSGYGTVHSPVQAQAVGVYLCPADGRRVGIPFDGQRRWGLTGYNGVAGTGLHRNDGVFHRDLPVRFADLTDGTSNTVMMGERTPGPNGEDSGWYAMWGDSPCLLSQILAGGVRQEHDDSYPAVDCGRDRASFRPGRLDDWCDLHHFWSLHPGGANFAFADGSVRFLPYTAAPVLPALATRAGGEVISPD